MTEQQLIDKIKTLRRITPRKEWVVLTKGRILGEEKCSFTSSFISIVVDGIKREIGFAFRHKPAFAILAVLLILVGLFGFVQKSMPGDSLFVLKKITERSQTFFVSEKEQPKRNLELANKRLEDLTRIAESNQAEKLSPAINEFQATVSQAAKSLATEQNLVGEQADKAVKEIVVEIKKLQKNKEKVEALGVIVGETKELDNALARLVEREIKDIETRSLTEKQQEVLSKVKEDYQAGNYPEALEKILLLLNG